MRMLCALTITATMTAALFGSALKIATDCDPAAHFDTYRTYKWTDGTPSPDTVGEQHVHNMVDARLAAKAFTQIDSNPDVYVSTHVITQQPKELVASGFAPWRFGGGTVSVDTYVNGTLVVDLYDAQTRRMVWRGVGIGAASDKASKNTEKIERVLTPMYDRYPR
jgi:hypothetical protein